MGSGQTSNETREGDPRFTETIHHHNPKTIQGEQMNETTEHTGQSNGVKLTSAPKEEVNYQEQLRAATKERSRLSQRVQELEPYQAQVKDLTAKLSESTSRYNQDMHLVELGINSERARRAIRREYREEITELQEDDRPEFGAFVTSLKQDAFYGKLFDGMDESKAKPEPEPTRRRMTTDPNAGADQPKDNTRPLDEHQYKSIKSRAERVAMARKHGLIK